MLALVLLAVAIVAQPLPAQLRRLPVSVIGQIADEVLSHVIPPDSSLSRMPIRERGIYFDYGRTLAAFGYRDDSTTRAALALKSVVVPGTDSLLEDCDQVSAKPCDRLGQHAYAYVTPQSRSKDAMVVLLHVAWPDRGGATYVSGLAPAARAYLTWFSMEVHLRRGADGRWWFDKRGRAMVGD
jgi:hypothetical protein